jgi:hypothetical protein
MLGQRQASVVLTRNKMTTRRGDDHDGIRMLGSWSQANSVLAQDVPLGIWETASGAGRFYRYLHTLVVLYFYWSTTNKNYLV